MEAFMATTNAHYNAAHARPVTAWKQRLGTGVVAWVAIGVASALLDPRTHGAGVISLFGGVGAWLATGAGLAAAYTIARAVYHRNGRATGVLAGCLSLAVVFAVLALTDWHAVTQVVMTLVCGVIGLALLAIAPSGAHSTPDSSDTELNFGGTWRWGNEGPGFYSSSGILLDSDDDD
jgi:hypothetical protein